MLRSAAFLLLAALLLSPAIASAQTPAQVSGRPVTVTIINGDFLTTLVRLERQYHIQCVLRDGVDAHSKVNASISGVPLFQALRLLASCANAQMTQSDNGLYMFAPNTAPLALTSDYTMPPPHFTGGFGAFGFSRSLQQYPVIFPHTLPGSWLDLVKGRDLEQTQPGKAHRVYGLVKSF